MLDVLSAKIDSVHNIRTDAIGLYSSNSEQPDFVGNYKGAKSTVDKMSNGYSPLPYSPFDKATILEKVGGSDLSNITALNLYFFVNESYLGDDLMKTNSGLLLNILPEELRFLLGCDQEKVNVFIFFPASSKTVNEAGVLNFCRLTNMLNGGNSGIKYHVQGI
jgi:hypothetical protein